MYTLFTKLEDLRQYYDNTKRTPSKQAEDYLNGIYGRHFEFYVSDSRAFGKEYHKRRNVTFHKPHFANIKQYEATKYSVGQKVQFKRGSTVFVTVVAHAYKHINQDRYRLKGQTGEYTNEFLTSAVSLDLKEIYALS